MLQYLTIGKFELPMYGLMIMIGAVLAVAFAMRRAKQTTISPDDVLYSITYTALGVILGAKLLYVIVSWNQLSGNWSYYFSSFKAFREFLGYGFVFYGGLLGGLAVFIPYCIKKKLNLGEMINCVVPSIPLIHSIGRIGCFCAGCCYGIPMDPPWGVYFRSTLAPHGVALFPVQLLEAALNLILFCILYTYARKPRKPGKVLGYYLVAYGIERFFLEFLRGDLERGMVFGISTSQFISLILIPVGLILAFWKFEEKIGLPALAGPGALTGKNDETAEDVTKKETGTVSAEDETAENAAEEAEEAEETEEAPDEQEPQEEPAAQEEDVTGEEPAQDPGAETAEETEEEGTSEEEVSEEETSGEEQIPEEKEEETPAEENAEEEAEETAEAETEETAEETAEEAAEETDEEAVEEAAEEAAEPETEKKQEVIDDDPFGIGGGADDPFAAEGEEEDSLF